MQLETNVFVDNVLDILSMHDRDYITTYVNARLIIYTFNKTDEVKLAELFDCSTPDIELRQRLSTNFTATIADYISNPNRYPSVAILDIFDCEIEYTDNSITLNVINEPELQFTELRCIFIVGNLKFEQDDTVYFFPVPNVPLMPIYVANGSRIKFESILLDKKKGVNLWICS